MRCLRKTDLPPPLRPMMTVIEPGGRLVEEHDLGLGHERARDGHALTHAARDLGGIFLAHALESHLSEGRVHALGDLGFRQPHLLAQGKGDVVGAAHRVEERAALEDDTVAPADRVEWLAAQARDLLVVHEDAAGIGL